VSDGAPEELREALFEMQQYLSDAVPPLVVTESIAFLLASPPEPVATAILAWTHEQLAQHGGGAQASDYFFHAARKLHLVGEFRLVPRDALAAYLQKLGTLLLELCPAEQRASLAESLARLPSSSSMAGLSAGPVLTRGIASAPPANGVRSDEAGLAQSMRRLTALLKQLEHLPAVQEPTAKVAGRRSEVESRILAGAIGSARSSDELRLYREHLARMGVDATPARAFRLLGNALPAWTEPETEDEPAPPPTRDSPREAMRRLVALETESGNSATRYHELVNAAVEQFNEGSLARAVTMLDTAARLVEDGEVNAAVAETARARYHEQLDRARLGALAGNKDAYALLRRLMAFFPALSPDALLDALQAEERRDRRRLMIQLLEATGPAARELAFQRLKESLENFGTADFFFKRNLILLLRRIPRDGSPPVEEELALVSRLSERGQAAIVVKEAIAHLAQTRFERAEQILRERLKQFEGMLLAKNTVVYTREELLSMLDRAVSGLARLGSQSAWRAVVEHGLRRQADLGDTTARLAELGSQDLSTDKVLVERLLAELAARMPRKVLGVTVKKDSAALQHLVASLSGTRDPRVQETLGALAEQFGGEEFAATAEKALVGATPQGPVSAATTPALAGDLALMDLPTLLQNLASTGASGVLRLATRDSTTVATLDLAEGQLLRCQCSDLSGSPAFFQVFERPAAATFTFTTATSPAPASAEGAAPVPLVPLLFEAMRRFDELANALALVPDDARFRAAAAKPVDVPGEGDAGLLRAVWTRAATGSTAQGCEAALGLDSYRVRRLLAHWVEEGALETR
jgi:Domain of unknown function (DUF4388)